MNQVEISDEDFVRIFGCDKESYDLKIKDPKLYKEIERKIETEKIYMASFHPEHFIGYYIVLETDESIAVRITDIRECYNETNMYNIYSSSIGGEEYLVKQLEKTKFHEDNDIFLYRKHTRSDSICSWD